MSRVMGASRPVIAVVGAGQCDARTTAAAHEIGRLIAQRGAILVTGGRTGVMEAASRGARDAGGLVVGILPGLDRTEANDAVEVAIPTGMGQLRNGLVVSTGWVVIAVGGEWGTLSEIGFALKLGKPVIGWHTWELAQAGVPRRDITTVTTPAEAVDRAFAHCTR
jgi:uncharacterized protein (TIGR00725 family)